jgi:hypothetical protein
MMSPLVALAIVALSADGAAAEPTPSEKPPAEAPAPEQPEPETGTAKAPAASRLFEVPEGGLSTVEELEGDFVETVPGLDGPPVRVERRALVKVKKVFLTGGLSYLSRGDYYTSPGLTGNFTYYPLEQHGLEFNLNLFLSFISPGAIEIFSRTGLVPDAQRPVAQLNLGYRYTFGYGKAVVGPSLSGLIHFDVQAAGHLGLTITDRAANPTLGLGPALVVRFSKLWVMQLDVPLQFALEGRARSFFTLGVSPRLAMGVML